MPTIIRFEDMEVWQTARELTRLIYDMTHHEVFSKDFGLSNQMRRASVSIMSNIAEGFESRTNVLFKDYLGRAKASAGELRAQVYIAKDIEYIGENDFSQLIGLCLKCSRQISKFMQYLEQQPNSIRDEGIEYNV
jgi:four helix bundle protein